MTGMKTLCWTSVVMLVGMGAAKPACADTLTVSADGQFSSSVIADQLAAPRGSWSLSFSVDSNPAVSNADALGFDAAFNNFSYTLDGATVAVTPGEIRFATGGNLGLFTVYFGPETGFLNGSPIPIFSIEGDQAFSGLTTSPLILAGDYPISDVTYSDALNYDDEGAVGTATITGGTTPPPPPPPVVAPVPEPSSWTLLSTGILTLIVGTSVRSKFSSSRQA